MGCSWIFTSPSGFFLRIDDLLKILLDDTLLIEKE